LSSRIFTKVASDGFLFSKAKAWNESPASTSNGGKSPMRKSGDSLSVYWLAARRHAGDDFRRLEDLERQRHDDDVLLYLVSEILLPDSAIS
jgi:hypothetical protein